MREKKRGEKYKNIKITDYFLNFWLITWILSYLQRRVNLIMIPYSFMSTDIMKF